METIKEKIEFLKNYNKWRRGEEIPQPNPTEIGVALNDVIQWVEKVEKINHDLGNIENPKSIIFIQKLFELLKITNINEPFKSE